MKRSTFKALYIVVTLSLFFFVWLLATLKMLPLAFITAVLGIGVTIMMRYRLRCPCCGRWPNRHSGWWGHCRRCGELLDDDDLI